MYNTKREPKGYITSFILTMTLIFILDYIFSITFIRNVGYAINFNHGFNNIVHALTLFAFFALPFKTVRKHLWDFIYRVFDKITFRKSPEEREIDLEKERINTIRAKERSNNRKREDAHFAIKHHTDIWNKHELEKRDKYNLKNYKIKVPII